jgi:hypothetical protein
MRNAIAFCLIAGYFICPPMQASQSPGCSTPEEYQPSMVANAEARVTFRCSLATPFDLIHAVGRQARQPIGVVIGQDANTLYRTPRTYDLRKVDGWSALQTAIEGTGYSLRVQNGVWEVIAGDLSPRQSDLLTLRLTDFKTNPNSTMVVIGSQLTMWLGAAIHPEAGYGASILGSTNDEQFTISPIPSATTEEIANRIVSLGSRGLWILRVGASNSASPEDDGVEVQPYQHYSNRVNGEQPEKP